MNKHFFKFAKEASKHATYTGTCSSPKIGGVAVYKGSIIAEAWNTNKTSPLQAKYNIYRFKRTDVFPGKQHCESALIQKIRWRFGDNIQWDKVHIYLYREHSDGRLAMSRCCTSCINMLKDLGIKKIFYTTPDGYVEEDFK